jgi:hypothetical protein
MPTRQRSRPALALLRPNFGQKKSRHKAGTQFFPLLKQRINPTNKVSK